MYIADRFFRNNQECFKVSDSAGNTVTRRHFTIEECSTPDRDSIFKFDGRVGLRGVEYEVVAITSDDESVPKVYVGTSTYAGFDLIHATSENGEDASWNADIWAIVLCVWQAFTDLETGPPSGLGSWNVTIQSW